MKLRRIHGLSMSPALLPGRIVVAGCGRKPLRKGDVVLFRHEGMDKVKRVVELTASHVYLLGDNGEQSTDSRHYGWVPRINIEGKILWPNLNK